MRELKPAGWTKARALVGGWGKWVELGLPVEAKGSGVTRSAAGSSWLRRAAQKE
ncbi:MAG TPA: hypothetical protein VH438_13835 [Gemmatimonadales bacterium]